MHGVREAQVGVVLGSASWLKWLPAFLPATTITWLSEEFQRDADRILPSLPGMPILFLSHHDTLARDLHLAALISGAHGNPTFCQPAGMVELALDKVRMAELVAPFDGLEAIPSLDLREARRMLSREEAPAIVVKLRRGTEGRGMRIARTVEELDLAGELTSQAECVCQPFIRGDELSVNMAWHAGNHTVYAPVHKGPTDLGGMHPSRRIRRFPAPLDHDLGSRLIQACAGCLRGCGPCGLVEVEIIHNDQGFFLLEVNPRLAATMRMTAVASKTNIFDDLVRAVRGDSVLDGFVPPSRCSLEWPIPGHLDDGGLDALGQIGDVWISQQRITIAADTQAELCRKAATVESLLTRGGQGRIGQP